MYPIYLVGDLIFLNIDIIIEAMSMKSMAKIMNLLNVSEFQKTQHVI